MDLLEEQMQNVAQKMTKGEVEQAQGAFIMSCQTIAMKLLADLLLAAEIRQRESGGPTLLLPKRDIAVPR